MAQYAVRKAPGEFIAWLKQEKYTEEEIERVITTFDKANEGGHINYGAVI